MVTIVDLENSIVHLEEICQQMHNQAIEFYPGEEFVSLDSESCAVLEAIADVKQAIYLARFNHGIATLELQLERLETRRRQLENFFFQNQNDAINDSMLNLYSDILQTKKEIHTKKHQGINLILNDSTHQLLEKYQLIQEDNSPKEQ